VADKQARRAAPITVLWPIRDDNVYEHWLVPGDWTRGQAIAYVAREVDGQFVRYRARRVWLRWAHLQQIAGWAFDDGTLTPCEPGDDDAEPYWAVTEVAPATIASGAR